MKVYLLTDRDIEQLRSSLSENPHQVRPTEEAAAAFAEAHRFYRYRFERWLELVRSDADPYRSLGS